MNKEEIIYQLENMDGNEVFLELCDKEGNVIYREIHDIYQNEDKEILVCVEEFRNIQE